MSSNDFPFWVYILENPDGRFYIGHTNDTARRVVEHNDTDRGHTTFSHKNGPWKLVWSEPQQDRSAAMRREKQIKSMKSAKWIRETLLNR